MREPLSLHEQDDLAGVAQVLPFPASGSTFLEGGSMRYKSFVTWVATAGFLAAPGLVRGAEIAPDGYAVAKGQVTYVRYCVACHGKGAKGDGPLASELRVAVPDLTTLAARSGGKYPLDRVVRIIESGEIVRGHGTADMPAWGDVFQKTKGTGEANVAAAIRNLSHYLWSVQQPAK